VAFTWIKENQSDGYFTGMGYWTRANPEMCLLATRGKPKRISKSVKQLVVDVRREHSRKPDCVRNRIVELCGDLPRIELFARQKVDGWDNWGNEIL
jgi:site-specific DNA-methyltransferase (adenine-specific)